jgi:prephenate dehydrogenase
MVTPQMLIMDVGSTKGDVIDAAKRALREQIGSFVPVHPIAGKEVSGVDHADADLYSGKQVILTPIQSILPRQWQLANEVWSALGCKLTHMSPEAHDAAFAAISHLPHLLSFALMNAITQQAQSQQLLALAGPGFRDFSRIAASDPKVWRDILLSNRDELLKQSQLFKAQLQALEDLMTRGDAQALECLIEQASTARAHWHMTHKQNQC